MTFKRFSFTIFTLLLIFDFTFAQSPYKLDLTKDAAVIGTGIASSVTALIIDSKVKSLSIEEINKLSLDDINSFDRGAAYNWSEDYSLASDLLVSFSAAAPALLFLSEKVRKDFITVSAMYLETMIYSMALPYLAKGSFQRARPFVYNKNVSLEEKLLPDAKKSFFSGHTTMAFSTAVFLSTVYGDYFPDSKNKPYVWAGSLLIATLTGYSRYEAGKHFPTDIIAGAIVGSAIGYIIPLIHRQS
ncbi:MAG: phosphatase PAP2 family protein, partial [Bacteroidetes bacterium]|nr:phosphatase PAP2 family protein [Bacteroidota bacterium]